MISVERFFKALDEIIDAEDQDNDGIKAVLFPVAMFLFLLTEAKTFNYIDILIVSIGNSFLLPLFRITIDSSRTLFLVKACQLMGSLLNLCWILALAPKYTIGRYVSLLAFLFR